MLRSNERRLQILIVLACLIKLIIMRRKPYSPIVKCEELPHTRLMRQEYKRPDGKKFIVKYDEVSLIMQQHKLLRALSPDDIRYLIESIGNNPELDSSKQLSDEELMSIVESRHIQEPCILKKHIEVSFAAYKEGKQTYEQALKSFKSGDYVEKVDDSNTSES